MEAVLTIKAMQLAVGENAIYVTADDGNGSNVRLPVSIKESVYMRPGGKLKLHVEATS